MPTNDIPEFDQIVEYVTEGPVFHAVRVADLTAEQPADTALNRDQLILTVMEGFVHALKIKTHSLDLAAAEWDNPIPIAIRLRINTWLTSRGYPNVPSGYTWRQLLAAIKARLS